MISRLSFFSVHSRISETKWPIFNNFVHLNCGHGTTLDRPTTVPSLSLCPSAVVYNALGVRQRVARARLRHLRLVDMPHRLPLAYPTLLARPWEGEKYCDEYVCLSVLSVHSHISETTWPSFTDFMHVYCGRGLFLLCRCFDTFCTSGFVNDVMFSHNGSYGSIV